MVGMAIRAPDGANKSQSQSAVIAKAFTTLPITHFAPCSQQIGTPEHSRVLLPCIGSCSRAGVFAIIPTLMLTKMVTLTMTLGDVRVAQWAQSTSQTMRLPAIQVRHDDVSGDNDAVVIIVISIIMRKNPGRQHWVPAHSPAR